jgi:hypothetical protein
MPVRQPAWNLPPSPYLAAAACADASDNVPQSCRTCWRLGRSAAALPPCDSLACGQRCAPPTTSARCLVANSDLHALHVLPTTEPRCSTAAAATARPRTLREEEEAVAQQLQFYRRGGGGGGGACSLSAPKEAMYLPASLLSPLLREAAGGQAPISRQGNALAALAMRSGDQALFHAHGPLCDNVCLSVQRGAAKVETATIPLQEAAAGSSAAWPRAICSGGSVACVRTAFVPPPGIQTTRFDWITHAAPVLVQKF